MVPGSPALRARISAARARPRSVAAATATAFWERVGASPPRALEKEYFVPLLNFLARRGAHAV